MNPFMEHLWARVDATAADLKTLLHEHVDSTVDSRLGTLKPELASLVRSGDVPQMANHSIISFREGIPSAFLTSSAAMSPTSQCIGDVTFPFGQSVSIPLDNVQPNQHQSQHIFEQSPYHQLSPSALMYSSSLLASDNLDNTEQDTSSQSAQTSNCEQISDESFQTETRASLLPMASTSAIVFDGHPSTSSTNSVSSESPSNVSSLARTYRFADQIEQSHHTQEEHHHLSDIEHELQMLRNVFMKPTGQPGGPFRCHFPLCGKPIGPDEQQKLAHLKVHTKPYVCDFDGCVRRFTCQSTCTRHKKTHTVNVLQCDLPGCVKRFKNIGTLNLHKRDHTDPKVTICGWADCDKVFYFEGNYQSHYLTHSDDDIDDDQLVCDWVDCARKFTTQYNLFIHRNLHKD